MKLALLLSLSLAACSSSKGTASPRDAATAVDSGGSATDVPEASQPTAFWPKLAPYAPLCARLAACVDDTAYRALSLCATLMTVTAESANQAWLDDVRAYLPYLAPLSVRSCIESAQSCSDVTACLNGTAPSTCTGPKSSCDGDTLTFCTSEGAPWRVSCRGLGLECRTIGEFAACVSTSCSTDGVTCASGELTYCSKGVALRVDCTPLGQTCAPGVNTCVGAGAACEPGSPTTCDGAIASSCVGGRVHTVDCSALAENCVASEEQGLPGGGCEPAFVGSTCSAGVVSLDGDGIHVETTCKALGLRDCQDEQRCGF